MIQDKVIKRVILNHFRSMSIVQLSKCYAQFFKYFLGGYLKLSEHLPKYVFVTFMQWWEPC